MSSCVLVFQEIDKTKLSVVGGKGVNLGELSRIEGITVPEGFCVTMEAYRQIMERTPELPVLFRQLALFKAEDRAGVKELSGKIRSAIEETAIPEEIAGEISSHLMKLGDQAAYAVRSSATAEDLPGASFAGQQDTYLNVIGKDAILKHVSRCWASLFTERAVIYRLHNGFAHGKVLLSVVIQKMVFPDAAGILFTADPINGNRKVAGIFLSRKGGHCQRNRSAANFSENPSCGPDRVLCNSPKSAYIRLHFAGVFAGIQKSPPQTGELFSPN